MHSTRRDRPDPVARQANSPGVFLNSQPFEQFRSGEDRSTSRPRNIDSGTREEISNDGPGTWWQTASENSTRRRKLAPHVKAALTIGGDAESETTSQRATPQSDLNGRNRAGPGTVVEGVSVVFGWGCPHRLLSELNVAGDRCDRYVGRVSTGADPDEPQG